MAERRMFAKKIINSARFLKMPTSSRLLYYDLGMSADDEGVVEAFSVMRLTGATEDDLRVLVSKEFVKVINDELVAVILDWKQNNLIKNDRFHPSLYHDLLLTLNDDDTWNAIGTQMEPESSLGKSSQVKSNKFIKPTLDEVLTYCKERNNSIDAQSFMDYYDSVGWKVGSKPMKDWKACVRTWEQRRAKPKDNVPDYQKPIDEWEEFLNANR